MNAVMYNTAVMDFDDYQCDFSFSFAWQDDSSFVLHTDTGNCLTDSVH